VNRVDHKVVKALVVEIIRVLWDRGLYRDNKWLRMCHDNWIKFWIDWRTEKTMADVDRQIEDLLYESEMDPPLYWEEEEGDTPLGGAMGLRHDFTEKDDA
jgi:hypothetical protein